MPEIESLHPSLITTLVEHPGIGFVMVRADEDGAIVLGAGGSRRLRDDAVTGEDLLLHFGPNAADHLRRTDGFPHCPDILVNCTYHPEANEVAPFEEFMGSHGGLGGWQSHSRSSRAAGARRRAPSSASRPCTRHSAAGSPRRGWSQPHAARDSRG